MLLNLFSPVSEVLRSEPTFFVVLSVIFGLLLGSFLNVVIYRLPKMLQRQWHDSCAELQGQPIAVAKRFNLITPRSACPHCGHAISAVENIPLLSYLWLKGRCKACQAGIGIRYPLVELITGIILGLIAYRFGYTSITLFAWIFSLMMITLTLIDLDTQLLPDDITLPLLWLGLLINVSHTFTDLTAAVIGAVMGYLILWAVYWLFKLTTGKEGMGYGDFKLLAAIGAWFGWQMLPAVILMSSVSGAVIGILLIVFKGRSGSSAIPFGPYLALGGMAALFFGPQLAQWF